MKTKVIFTLALIAGICINSLAQEKPGRFGIELNTGAVLAVSEPISTSLKPGFGFEGNFHYRITDYFGLYAGWGWNRMAAPTSFAGDDVCFEETGYVLGLQFKHPVNGTSLSYFLRAGGLYDHIEIENAGGEIVFDSGHGPGAQLAGGIDMNLGSGWSLQPGVKFSYLSRSIEFGGEPVQLSNNNLSFRLGVLHVF